jgi:hypothetical protein
MFRAPFYINGVCLLHTRDHRPDGVQRVRVVSTFSSLLESPFYTRDVVADMVCDLFQQHSRSQLASIIYIHVLKLGVLLGHPFDVTWDVVN